MLSIAIPTYNRSNILCTNLARMYSALEQHSVTVYIYDDSDNDTSKKHISSFLQSFDSRLIVYHANQCRLGHDGNCLNALKNTPGDYIWYLGDTLYVTNEGLSVIVGQIKGGFHDAIVVSNHSNRTRSLVAGIITSPDTFLAHYAWHATLTGVTIYSRRLIDRANKTNPRSVYGSSNFAQLGFLLDGLCSPSISVLFINSVLVSKNSLAVGNYWIKDPIGVFCIDWYDFCYSLPDVYSDSAKLLAVKSHHQYTRLFAKPLTYYLYGREYITKSKYLIAKHKCDACITSRRWLFLLIINSPMIIAKLFVLLVSRFRGLHL